MPTVRWKRALRPRSPLDAQGERERRHGIDALKGKGKGKDKGRYKGYYKGYGKDKGKGKG